MSTATRNASVAFIAGDGRGRHAGHVGTQAGAEHGIHDHGSAAQALLPDLHVGLGGQVRDRVGRETVQHVREARRVSADLGRRQSQEDLHVGATAQEVASDHESITAILPGTAHDAHVEGRHPWPFPRDDVRHPPPGVFHEHEAREVPASR